MDKRIRPLLPPPRLQRHAEPRAVIEPPLHELAASRPPERIDEWTPFSSGSAERVLTDDLARRAQAAALASARVKRLLAAKRFVAIGASLREQRDTSKEKAFTLRYVFYNYTDNVTLEVTLDGNARAVAGVSESRWQPPPIPTSATGCAASRSRRTTPSAPTG